MNDVLEKPVDTKKIKQILDANNGARIRTWLSICSRCGLCAESCFFYLRLSKQDAYLGDVRITYAEDAISLRAKLEAYPAKQETCLRLITDYFHEEG